MSAKHPRRSEAAKHKRPAGMGGLIHDVQSAIDDQNAVLSERERNRRLMDSIRPPFEKAVRPVGRPSLYTDDMPEIVYNLFTRYDAVMTKRAVAAHLGIDESTLRRWRDDHPEFRAAIAQGLAVQEAYLATKMSDGIKYSQSLYAVLKNLHDWADKTEQRTTIDLTEAIKRQSMKAERVVWDRALPVASPRAQTVPPALSSQDILRTSFTDTCPDPVKLPVGSTY